MWWHTATHGGWGGKWRGNFRMERVDSTLHTTSEHGVSSITTADAHTSSANSRLNWRPRRFKWTSPFRRKTKSGFCACAITFHTQSAARSCRRPRPTLLKAAITRAFTTPDVTHCSSQRKALCSLFHPVASVSTVFRTRQPDFLLLLAWQLRVTREGH